MTPEPHLTQVTNLIQLAVAPVFLLTAIGAIVNVLASRLARVVDRIRVLEERAPASSASDEEVASLERRLRLTYVAIALSVVSAVCVGVLIAVAFVDPFVAIDLAAIVGVLFVVSLACLIAALMTFLREIFHAIEAATARSDRRRASK